MKRTGTKALALALVFSTTVASLPVQAVPLSTEEALGSTEAHSDARARLQAFLARGDVQAALMRHGVSAELAAQRVAVLSDEEVAQLDRQIETLPAGGDVLGVIVFVFLVLLVTDILGLTKVFPFTRPIR